VVGNGSREQSLARPRRTVQQHAFWLGNAKRLKELRVLDRQFDHLHAQAAWQRECRLEKLECIVASLKGDRN